MSDVENLGEMDFKHANDANIPVNIFMSEVDEDDGDVPNGHKWVLSAGNFMPRKCVVSCGAYRVSAVTRDELAEVVRKHILPLYEIAMTNLVSMIAGTNKSLYYWTKP